MAFFSRIIAPSLSPNTSSDDVLAALRILCTPWLWKKGGSIKKVREWFLNYYGETVYFFNSGRSALLALLSAFDIGKGDEVIMQAFTCVAVPNAVLWAGATPVYADISDRFNIDPDCVEQKITQRTRAIIVQHTFGIPADIGKITVMAKKYNLIVIEDCAHSLGIMHQKEKIGSFGDAAFFSFGRDKMISSVWGGGAMIKAKFRKQNNKLEEFENGLRFPSYFWIFRQIIHPIAFSVILPTYSLVLGKILLVLLQRLHLLTFPVFPEEKLGKKPSLFPARYPDALATLLVSQLRKFDAMMAIRSDRCRQYTESLGRNNTVQLCLLSVKGGLLRFPVSVFRRDELLYYARSRGVLLGNWYHTIIDPAGCDFDRIGYAVGSCPHAEAAAARIINLPTLISAHEAEKVIACIRDFN